MTTLQIYDDAIPAIDAGTYQIEITQSIENLDTRNYFDNPVTQPFEVRAPQFALDAGDLIEQFPPDNSSGTFERDLPHVVLGRRALPWIRPVSNSADRSTPWLALLAFSGDELSTIDTVTVSQLLADDGDILKPQITGVPQDVLDSSCQTITISLDLFHAVVPHANELQYLAHVRQTSTDDQAPTSDDDGWYSVVVANRFPDSTGTGGADGAKNTVCLVSLEGLYDVIDGNTPAGKARVALAVLTTWSFVSLPIDKQGASFSDLMLHFVAEENGDPKNLLPRVVPSTQPSNADAAARLADGYVPLAWVTPSGERTFAWYRGPLTPVIPQSLPDTSSTSSAAVTIYLEEQGVFDLSYAAAWEIGRALALADRSFSLAITSARTEIFRQLRFAQQRVTSGLGDWSEGIDALNERTRGYRSIADRVSRPRARRGDPGDEMRAMLAREDVRAWIAEQTEDMDPVTDFLAALQLLVNVPFVHLIPDERMLPIESIRFFTIDPSWIAAMVDGAMSLGITSSRDVALNAILREPLRRVSGRKVGRRRARLRGKPHLAVDTDGPPRTGLLIRSSLIAGWPALQVVADDGATRLLRIDSLSSDVLLCLFDNVPQTVTLSEPMHSLRFGVDDRERIALRDENGDTTGSYFPASGTFSDYFRVQSVARVTRIADVASAMAQELQLSALSPAIFAVEMVQAPERLTFQPGAQA